MKTTRWLSRQMLYHSFRKSLGGNRLARKHPSKFVRFIWLKFGGCKGWINSPNQIQGLKDRPSGFSRDGSIQEISDHGFLGLFIPISMGALIILAPQGVHDRDSETHIPNHRNFAAFPDQFSFQLRSPGFRRCLLRICCHVLVDSDHRDGRPGFAAWTFDGGCAVAMQRSYAGGASQDVPVPYPELWYSFLSTFFGRPFCWRFLVENKQVDRFFNGAVWVLNMVRLIVGSCGMFLLRWECSSVTSGLGLMCFVCLKIGCLGELSIHAFQKSSLKSPGLFTWCKYAMWPFLNVTLLWPMIHT